MTTHEAPSPQNPLPGEPGAAPPPPAPAPVVEVPFWQRPRVQNLTSLLGSVVIHALLVSLALLTYTTYVELRPVEEEQVIIPDAAIVEGATPGGIPNPGLGGDPTRPAEQDQVRDVLTDSQSFSAVHSKPLSSSLMSDTPGAPEAGSLIGLGQGGAVGATPGAGQLDAGPIAPLGLPGGGSGIGPRSPFMGIGGNALRVAYVCDASGSMVDKIDVLKAELVRSIEVLKPIQSFNVIFFNSKRFAADERSLLVATPQSKRKCAGFIQGVAPMASTDPLPALDLAFKQNVQLIYLLTDGDFENPDNRAVRDHLRKLNPQKRVKVNTIAFVSDRDDATMTRARDFVDFLALLARENGGVSRVVATSDFDR